MIKVEHDYVGLTAIDTRMRAQVLAQQRTVLLKVALDPRDLVSDVRRSISQVVPAEIDGMTSSTATLPGSLRLVRERERTDRLGLAAVVAASSRGFGHERPREGRVGPSAACWPLEEVCYLIATKKASGSTTPVHINDEAHSF